MKIQIIGHVKKAETVIHNESYQDIPYSKLDQFVCDGEAEEILCYQNFLNQFTYTDVPNIIANLHRKLKYGGTLVIQFVDLLTAANRLVYGNIELNKFNELVHQHGHQCSLTPRYLGEIFMSRNLVILKSTRVGDSWVMMVKRPELNK